MTTGTETETVSREMPEFILEPLEEAPTTPAADVGRCLEHLVETLATAHASLAAIAAAHRPGGHAGPGVPASDAERPAQGL